MKIEDICNTKTIRTIEYDLFNKFVESKYGGSFEFVAQHEANNDSQYSFTVSEEDHHYWGKNEKEEIRNGEYGRYSVGSVLQLLFEDGYITEGEYVIEVCW